MMRSRVLAGAVVAATMIACGAVPAAGASDFARQANAICARTSAALDRLDPPTTGHVAEYFRQAFTLAKHQYGAIARLHPPAADRKDVRQALELAHRQEQVILEALRALADRKEDPDQVVAKMDARITPLSEREDRLWHKVGADKCAS